MPQVGDEDGLAGLSLGSLETQTKAILGLAVAPVGGHKAWTLGTFTDGPAWSTSKILVVLAVVHETPNISDLTKHLIDVAIRSSDNAAADQLWSSLGSDQVAAAKLTAILRSAGDSVTTVPSFRLRSTYSVFGQTMWRLDQQAVFGARLACTPEAAYVMQQMRQVDATQSWGLGHFPGALFKGGWGPDPQGSYLVRQFGVVTLPDGGAAAVAIAAQPSDGRMDSGVRALDVLAEWIRANVHAVTPIPC